jgi:transposase-like protein
MKEEESPADAPKTPKLPIPPEVDGIQFNFCKNPRCENYGVPVSVIAPRGRPRAVGAPQTTYHTTGKGPGTPGLTCKLCGEAPPIKSNLGIAEELRRMLIKLDLIDASCPEETCANHVLPVSQRHHYQSFGRTRAGSLRYRCKGCGRLFSIAQKATLRQTKTHKNKLILKLLMNKNPMRRICEVADITPPMLYRRISFFHRQCLAFAASRERRLLEGIPIRRLYLAVDRQDYMINWTNQAERRNVQLHAIATADNGTGYVFGMHLDFDPTLDAAVIEADAAAIGDVTKPYAFRRYARLWLKADYTDALRQMKRDKRKKSNKINASVTGKVADTYADTEQRDDVEVQETHDFDTKLPARGMQIHCEYTLYAHFYFLERLFRGVEKVRFFLDQESGIRAAFLAAFKGRVSARTADAFFVRINKDLTVNERRQSVARSRAEFEQAQLNHPNLSSSELKTLLIQQRMAQMTTIGKWNDAWVLHPFPSMDEPEKAMCCLTNLGDYASDHMARLYAKASLHAVDRFFMQVRRRLSLLERPIQTASAQGRTWFGYSPYNPEMVVKVLDIFRVFYNYIAVGEDNKTPAMRLGLARAPLALEDLIYYRPKA